MTRKRPEEYPDFVEQIQEYVNTPCTGTCSPAARRRLLVQGGIPSRSVAAIFSMGSWSAAAYRPATEDGCEECRAGAAYLGLLDHALHIPNSLVNAGVHLTVSRGCGVFINAKFTRLSEGVTS